MNRKLIAVVLTLGLATLMGACEPAAEPDPTAPGEAPPEQPPAQ